MERSDSIKELATALAKAQGEIDKAKKDVDNTFFKSKYADLASVVDAIKEPLSRNGLSYTQISHDCDNAAGIETIIFHSSGEWLSTGKLTVPVSKHDAQGFGSAMTYARRYSLSAAFGVAAEEDDGNAAAKAAPKGAAKVTPISAKSVAQSDFDNLPPDRQKAIVDLGTEIADAFAPASPEVAYDVYRHIMEALPLIEEQAALKSQLSSQIRTAFTKIYNERKTQLTPAGELAVQA